jgi:hypothetical protein
VYAAFLDLSKAFDKVNYNILLSKLIELQIPPAFVSILHCLYTNQAVSVSFNRVLSDQWLIGNGVRQGGILSPLLFSFYINEVFCKLTKLKYGCRLAGYNMSIIAYADDLVLLSPSATGLQELLNNVSDSLRTLCLHVNCAKCVCMYFKKCFSPPVPDTKIYMNNSQLSFVSSCKYLGIVLTNNLSIGNDVSRAEKSFLRQFYAVIRKFSFVDRNMIIFLLKSYCFSFYGAPLWGDAKYSCQNLKSLAVSYHNAVKKVVNVPKRSSSHDACDEANLLTFKHLLNMMIFGFMFSLLNTSSICALRFKEYFRYHSKIAKDAQYIAVKEYDMFDLFENDFEAVLSRIAFVQQRERFQGQNM